MAKKSALSAACFGGAFWIRRGKTNRWVCRYYDNRKRPSIVLPIDLSPKDIAHIESSGLEVTGEHIVIDTPENVLRISHLIIESYKFCQDDENFRRQKR